MRDFQSQSGNVVSLARRAKETIFPIWELVNKEFLKYPYKRVFFLYAEDSDFSKINNLTLIEVINDIEYLLFDVCHLTNDAQDLGISGYENIFHKIFSLEQILDGLINPTSEVHKMFSSTLIWLGGNLIYASPNLLFTKHIVVKANFDVKDVWQACTRPKKKCAANQTLTDTTCQTIKNPNQFAQEVKTISGFGEVIRAYHGQDNIGYFETLEAAIISYKPATKIIHAMPEKIYISSDEKYEIAYALKGV